MLTAVGSYDGDGMASQAVTGVGFEPDLVCIHGGSNEGVYRQSTQDAGASFGWSRLNTHCDAIVSFQCDGFTVGADATVNSCGTTYYYAAFADNGDGDFEVGTYTGNGSDDRTLTIGLTPILFWTCRADAAFAPVWKSSAHACEATSRNLDSSADQATDNIQALGCGSVQLGTNGSVNSNTFVYHYFAFADVSGEIAVGNYTGNATDNTSVCVGFAPDIVWVKAATAVKGRFRSTSHACDQCSAMTFGIQSNEIQSFNCCGFVLGSDAAVNGCGVTFHWVAWKIPAAASTTKTAINALLHQHYRRFV